MPNAPILLFLHGVGDGDPDGTWQDALERSLTRLGYPDLSGVKVLAPKYPNGLRGVDDEERLPKLTVKAPRGDDARSNRRDYARRRSAMEVLLGRDDCGDGRLGGDQIAPVVAGMRSFVQADNYTKNPQVRAWVLHRILKQLPESGRLVIVGHSLGSVIAADLVRRLPVDLEVAGMVTIGSPLAQKTFDIEGLRTSLAAPPKNLAWWVNLWSTADPVPTRRGVSMFSGGCWINESRHPSGSIRFEHTLQRRTCRTTWWLGLLGMGCSGASRRRSSSPPKALTSRLTMRKLSHFWRCVTHT